MVEFTGERVIPGKVNADLWSEHFSRYAFAARFAAGQSVLDAGCGTGYGCAELAQTAATVTGFDLSPEAANHARASYPLRNLHFLAAPCEQLPFPGHCFDLITAFEVIEHLNDHRQFIQESARVLKPAGLLIVSTPNKLYYAETRAQTGPNPFHTHEFEPEEFYRELASTFSHVHLLMQNRSEAFAFYPPKTFSPADARIDGSSGTLTDSHFLIALCSQSAFANRNSFVYVPKATNLLREREQHIQLLERQVDQTKAWLSQTRTERDELLALYRSQKDELEARNRWAAGLNQQLDEASTRVAALQGELVREQAAGKAVAEAYESQVQAMEGEIAARTQWALDTEARLTQEIEQKKSELLECVRLLHATEQTLEERTLWAQQTDAQREALSGQLNAARASRWIRLGRRLGLGPVLQEP